MKSQNIRTISIDTTFPTWCQFADKRDMLSFFGIRTQSTFAPDQVLALKEEFSKNMYPSIQEKEEIATRLSLTKKQVNQWFSDHRFRFKSKKP